MLRENKIEVANVTVIMSVSDRLSIKVGHTRGVPLSVKYVGQIDDSFQCDLRRGRGETDASWLVWKSG